MTQATYYTSAKVSYQGLAGPASQVLIPWVSGFSSLSSGVSLCVLSNQSGQSLAGLYALIALSDGSGSAWRLVMLMSDLSALLSANSTLSLVLNVNGSQTFGTPTVVYCNGQLVPSGLVQTDAGAVYALVTPVASVKTRRNTVLFGDSIPAQANDVTPTGWTLFDFRGIFTHANMRLNAALNLVANCGVNGNTTTQMRARLGSGLVGSTTCDPLAFPHDLCIVIGGTNDIAAMSTGSTAVAQAQATISNLKYIVQTLQSNGITVSLATVPPRGTDAAASTQLGGIQRTARRIINSWIRQFCAISGGPILFDLYRAVANPSTEAYIANATIDGVHPNYQGASFAGAALATALTQIVIPADTGGPDNYEQWSPNGAAVGANASGTNGTTLGTGATGTAPNGWNVGASTGTASVVSSVVAPSASSLFQDRTAQIVVTAGAQYDGGIFRVGGQEISNLGAWAVANPLPGSRWQGSTGTNVGDKCIPAASAAVSAYAGLWAVCVQVGVTGSTEPVWPTQIGQQITDNSCVWEMVASPFAVRRNQHWGSSFYAGVGAIVRPLVPTGFYYLCTTAGLTAAAGDPVYSSIIGGTVVDGAAVWTTIAIPTYSFYAEFDFVTSGLTANAGAMLAGQLKLVDDSGTVTSVYASNVDINPSDFAANSSSLNPPAIGRMRTPVITLGNDKSLKFLILLASAFVDNGATITFGIKRLSIRSPITL